MRRVLLLSSLFLIGCEPADLPKQGFPMYQLFQYDTLRTWAWASDDPTIPYLKLGAQREETEKEEGTDIPIYAIDFTADCFNNTGVCEADTVAGGLRDYEEGILDTWKLSTEVAKGVRIHEAGGTVFDPPVKLADGMMEFKASTTPMESGGITYTSTYDAEELCPAESYWPDESTRPNCYKLVLDDGGADSDVAGSYWVVKNFGLIAFSRDIDNGAMWSIKEFADDQ